jgi:hypothetical protein
MLGFHPSELCTCNTSSFPYILAYDVIAVCPVSGQRCVHIFNLVFRGIQRLPGSRIRPSAR